MNDEILIYVMYDINKSIIQVISSVFLENTTGYTQVDKWTAGNDRYIYAHADNDEYALSKYGKPLYDKLGRPNYHDNFIEWSESEKQNLYPLSAKTPTEIEKLQEESVLLKAQVKSLSDRNDFMDDCIAEMATIVYA